jgi:hypothetical protein
VPFGGTEGSCDLIVEEPNFLEEKLSFVVVVVADVHGPTVQKLSVVNDLLVNVIKLFSLLRFVYTSNFVMQFHISMQFGP